MIVFVLLLGFNQQAERFERLDCRAIRPPLLPFPLAARHAQFLPGPWRIPPPRGAGTRPAQTSRPPFGYHLHGAAVGSPIPRGSHRFCICLWAPGSGGPGRCPGEPGEGSDARTRPTLSTTNPPGAATISAVGAVAS